MFGCLLAAQLLVLVPFAFFFFRINAINKTQETWEGDQTLGIGHNNVLEST